MVTFVRLLGSWNLIAAPSEGPGLKVDKFTHENCTGFPKGSGISKVFRVQFVVFGRWYRGEYHKLLYGNLIVELVEDVGVH